MCRGLSHSQGGFAMLTAITLENFKSYRQARLPLAPLTVLIGANASGKSNAIEGMRLLSWLAQGQRLSAIQYAVQSGDRLVRGRVEDLSFGSRSLVRLGCGNGSGRMEPANDAAGAACRWFAHRGRNLEPRRRECALYTLDQPSHERSTDCGVAYNNFAKGGKKPHIICSDQAGYFYAAH